MAVDPQFRRAPSDVGQAAFALAVSASRLQPNTSGVPTITRDRRLFSYTCTHFLAQPLCFETDAKLPGADPLAPIGGPFGPISHLIFNKQTNGEAMIPVAKASKHVRNRLKSSTFSGVRRALDNGFTVWTSVSSRFGQRSAIRPRLGAAPAYAYSWQVASRH
jgi:hypothetical protein